MKYFYVEPEVAGGIADRTVMDSDAHPPEVTRLHYEFDGWLGDAIVESFPVFIVTQSAKEELIRIGATGAVFDEVEVTVSGEYTELYPDQDLPPFVWMKTVGKAGKDDIAAVADGRLVLSRRAIDTFKKVGFSNADVEPYDGEP